ncbi:MAG: TolC family protein [Planctomycetota bacterium]
MYSVHFYRPRYPAFGSRQLFGVLAVFGLMVATGCNTASPFDRLDLEAKRIIEDQQARTLGPTAAYGDRIDPATPIDPRPADYDKNPATNNPTAAKLDTQRAPDNGPLPPPAILDDGSQADTLRLDLESLLAYAIEHSPEYRNEREALFLTTLSLIIERHEWGPRFFSAISGVVEGVPEAGDKDTALELIASLGVTQRLPYGGTVSASALVDYVTFLQQASTNTLPDETESVALQVTVDLPLLRGAGRSADTVETLIQAERDLVYAVRGFERFRREYFVDLSTRYFDLLRRQRQLANRELQLRNLEQSAELFTALAEAGRQSYFQSQRAEQRVLRARNSLVNQQEAYASQIDDLKIRIGIPTTRPVEIVPVDIDVPGVLLDADRSVQNGLELRLDLQTIDDQVDDARREVLIAKNNLLPDLDFNGSLFLPTSETIISSDSEFDAGDGDFEAGLTLDLPLDRKIEYTDYRAALVRLEREKRDRQVSRDRVALEVRAAVRAIEQARYIVQLQDRAVQINERRAEQIEINQRDLGPEEVIDVQEDLLDARDDRDAAASDLRISILDYLLATGQMRIGPDGRWQAPGQLRAIADQPPLTPETPYGDTIESPLPAVD